MRELQTEVRPTIARQVVGWTVAVAVAQVALPCLLAPWLSLAYLSRPHAPLGVGPLALLGGSALLVLVGVAQVLAAYRVGRWAGCWR